VRFSLNLGPATRYLRFIPIELDQVFQLLKCASHSAPESLPNILGALAQSFPMTPVVELSIPPLQSYIAPTCNIFHDGFMENGEVVDTRIDFLLHPSARKP